jgi:predicted O-methyltransferase YrrM
MKFTRPTQWLRRHYLAFTGSVSAPSAGELQYQNLFSRDLGQLGLNDVYYPTGGSANSSLLYCLLRIVRDTPVSSVLELGCGESTRLLSALRAIKPLEIVSVEHEPFWRDLIANQVDHPIELCPLQSRNVLGRTVEAYTWSKRVLEGQYDLILVDGPPGTSRHSRRGALEVIEKTLADDFIILVDDAERRGEADTVQEIQRLLSSQGRKVQTRVLGGLQTQVILFTDKMSTVRSF